MTLSAKASMHIYIHFVKYGIIQKFILFFQVTFTPQSRGKHRVYVYLHGMEVKGSPFSLRIGKDVREPRKQATDIFKADRKVSR